VTDTSSASNEEPASQDLEIEVLLINQSPKSRLGGLHFAGCRDANFLRGCIQMTSDGAVFALEAFQRFGINHYPDLIISDK
jgi:hypothetical protein